MKDIQLTLSLEVNTLLNALGNQPYTKAQPLIAKIQTQGVHRSKPLKMGRQKKYLKHPQHHRCKPYLMAR